MVALNPSPPIGQLCWEAVPPDPRWGHYLLTKLGNVCLLHVSNEDYLCLGFLFCLSTQQLLLHRPQGKPTSHSGLWCLTPSQHGCVVLTKDILLWDLPVGNQLEKGATNRQITTTLSPISRHSAWSLTTLRFPLVAILCQYHGSVHLALFSEPSLSTTGYSFLLATLQDSTQHLLSLIARTDFWHRALRHQFLHEFYLDFLL